VKGGRDSMKIQPLADRIVVSVLEAKEVTKGGIVLPDTAQEKPQEAEVMAIAAERLGISAIKIKIDPKSSNTWEHAENLNKMFQDKDIKIGLVTSAYHMKRSEREFRKYFSHVIPLPSDYLYSSSPLSIMTFIPSSGSLYKFSTAFREMIGIAWYRIKG